MDDQSSGFGREVYWDGSAYEGSFQDGLRHGIGLYAFGNKCETYKVLTQLAAVNPACRCGALTLYGVLYLNSYV
jgi:hypothetical protein